MRADPGTRLDVVIRRNYGSARWTGPWDVDLTSLTLKNGHEWVLVQLGFSNFDLLHSGIREERSIGDSFSVFLDGDGDRHYEREILVNWGYRGGLLTEVDDQVLRCRFDPDSDAGRRTVTLRIPRRCFPHLTRMRARASISSIRHAGSTSWFGQDTSRWSRFAELGQTVVVSDPTR